MNESFADTLAFKTRRQIKQTTDRLAELLAKWVPNYDIIRPARIPMAALSTALVYTEGASGLSPADYLPIAKMTLWIFGVDDITDEQMVMLPEIRRKAEEWYSLARVGADSDPGRDELTTILIEVRKELAQRHMFEPLREEWASSLRSVLEGIVREYEYAQDYRMHGARALPPLDEYIYYGKCSIGVPLWSLSVLIVQGDPSAKQNFQSTSEAIEYAGAAIRLYNDLKSFDKEMQERTVNSIQIKYHMMVGESPASEGKDTLDQAKRSILALADTYAQKCYDLAAQVREGGQQFQESISRTVAFHADFYRQHDYHTTSLTETHNILNVS